MLGTHNIDGLASIGLLGTVDSLGYKVDELIRHHHNSEQWYGLGTTTIGRNTLAPIVITAGTTAMWGEKLLIAGGTEIEGGSATKQFDFHRIVLTAITTTAKLAYLRFRTGTAVVGGNAIVSEVPVRKDTNQGGFDPIEILSDRLPCNSPLWVEAMSEAGGDAISFFVGLHTYDA